MTKNEKLIVSAYTGVLMVDWNEFLDFAEEKLKKDGHFYVSILSCKEI